MLNKPWFAFLALWCLAIMLLLPMHALAEETKATGNIVLSEDFETNPLNRGWTVQPSNNSTAARLWTTSERHQGKHAIRAYNGAWESPAFPVESFAYYRITFYLKTTASGGVWAIVFYDQNNKPLIADNYSDIDPSRGWTKIEVCARANYPAVSARLRFQPVKRQRLYIDDVSVEVATGEEVAQWTDRVVAGMPPITYTPPAERCALLPRTVEKLRNGEELRIVMLGDSIINDTSNSLFETLLLRAYPKAKIQVITSVRGGTGFEYYQRRGRVQNYVLQYRPDLLIMGGVSTDNVESIRSVVKQVRATASPEIMLFTPVVKFQLDPETGKPWSPSLDPNGTGYRDRQLRIAREEGLEFVDFAAPFSQYAEGMGKPYAWLKRDDVHAGLRGKMVLGQILARYLSPSK